ncbi:tripartite tricarboxylate transporter substrate binding protein [soil metagenome]
MKINPSMTLRALVAAGVCLALPATGWAADAYPSKPIQVLVPLQVGTAADVATRVILDKVAINMKQSFIIENLPGVSGLLAAERISRAAPDGYTLGGITDSVLNYAANLTERLNFDPVDGFEPISQMANISWVLVANTSADIRTVGDLIEKAKAKPGGIDYATGGVGSPHHISMELFAKDNGIKLNQVPYKGAAAATNDVAGGHVPVMFSAVSVVAPLLADGRLHALAQPNEKRSGLLPDVPTFAEAGVKPFVFSTWLGLYAPKGTPKAIVERLNAEVAKAVADPAVRERLLALGLEPVRSTPAQLYDLTKAGYGRVGKAVKDAGIKPE